MRCLSFFLVAAALTLAGCDGGGPDGPGEADNRAPSADFSFTPLNPRAGQAVTFTANVSDPDGQVVTYSWDFDGDGSQDASGSSPTFEFDRVGNYTASLTVTDNDGATDRAVQSVSVTQRFNEATVTSVTVVDMPFVDGSGSGWDLTTGPDLYYASFDRDDQLTSTSSIFNDISPSSLPLTFGNGDFTIGNLADRVAIALFDRDDFDDDDFIGGIEFSLSSQVGDYPSTLRLDAGAGIVLDVGLDWRFNSANAQLSARPNSPLEANKGVQRFQAPESPPIP